jgi:hypothetical protein
MENNTIQNWLSDPSSVDENYATALSAIAPALLRKKRDELLNESDWVVIKEMEQSGSIPNYTEWKVYRQSLRDLPETQSPTINEFEQLTNVTWPTKPSD